MRHRNQLLKERRTVPISLVLMLIVFLPTMIHPYGRNGHSQPTTKTEWLFENLSQIDRIVIISLMLR